jgi:hypothetical protein
LRREGKKTGPMVMVEKNNNPQKEDFFGRRRQSLRFSLPNSL